MTGRGQREGVAAEFLRDVLAGGALGVPKLEAMARTAGLLGEGQRISTAKPFRKAKSALGHTVDPGQIWTRRGVALEIATDREAPVASSIKRQPVRTERRVPLDWIPIGGRRSICP